MHPCTNIAVFFNIVQNAFDVLLNIGWGNPLHLAFWKFVVSCLLLAIKLGLVSRAGSISLISPYIWEFNINRKLSVWALSPHSLDLALSQLFYTWHFGN